jgi:LmbE family N-acetylglucosaminyl deacetylase
MTKNCLVVSPHPDDEVLGVGGTLFRKKAEGCTVAWLIVSSISETNGWTKKRVLDRKDEIEQVSKIFSFDEVFELDLPSSELEKIPIREIVDRISKVFDKFKPNEVFAPHVGDVHSDHKVVARAVSSSSKWFRSNSVNRLLAYEVLSETDFGLFTQEHFVPNVFVDISAFLELKVDAMRRYQSEIGIHPFPRSEESIRALATVRGATAGCQFAESFQLLRERI